MTRYINTLETGSNGATITPASSAGSGVNAFTTVNGSPTFDNTRAAHGNLSAKLQQTSGAAGPYAAFGGTGGSDPLGGSSAAFRGYIYLTANPTASTPYFRMLDNTASVIARIDIGTGGIPTARYLGSAATAASVAIPLNTWVRFEMVWVGGTSGSVKMAYYNGDSTSPLDTVEFNGVNTGTNTFASFGFGKFNADNNATAIWFDDLAVDNATTNYIGPAAAVPPSLTLPANQSVSAGTTVNLAANASDSDGTIASYAWSFVYPTSGAPTLSGASSANVSFTSGSAGSLYILQCVVTDNSGLTASATTEVRVPSGGTIVPLSGTATTTGTWANVGGAASYGDALADSNDSTYAESGSVSATAQTIRLRLQPSATRTSLLLSARLAQDVSGSTVVKVRLVEGTNTVRQEWTQAVTTTPTDYSFTLTDVSAISDWGRLFLEVAVST